MSAGQSIDEFISELRDCVEFFEQDYKRHNAATPIEYPLQLPADNTGLWFEFFTDFYYGRAEE